MDNISKKIEKMCSNYKGMTNTNYILWAGTILTALSGIWLMSGTMAIFDTFGRVTCSLFILSSLLGIMYFIKILRDILDIYWCCTEQYKLVATLIDVLDSEHHKLSSILMDKPNNKTKEQAHIPKGIGMTLPPPPPPHAPKYEHHIKTDKHKRPSKSKGKNGTN
ncbi:hypothetical protein M0R04_05560 [Candidatus Dojkabacteria bacterium]|jgi:hypothetical protein|nr:hypothetical protein [Candidatus Dojkabacteria bacterium]